MTDDKEKRETVKGLEPHPDYKDTGAPQPINPETGQHDDHWVMTEKERAEKDKVRPVRLQYRHLKCGAVTRMPEVIAETYARDPSYYGSTFCCGCRDYFPVGKDGEFVWDDGSGEKVGT